MTAHDTSAQPATDHLPTRLALGNLAAQIGIIVTGGLVRVTGSGLGCSEWPLCEPGRFTPVFHEETSYHAYVEFGNRTLTSVLVLAAGAMLLAFYRRASMKARPRVFRRLAWAVMAGIFAQALIGGASVIWDLHPALVGSHMYISLLLVALSAYILARLRQADVAPLPPTRSVRLLALALGLSAALVLVAGVVTTGTGPHSGDANAPYRFALDPLLVTRIHSVAAWVFAALLLSALWLSRANLRPWLPLAGLTVLQGAAGYLQYFTGLPILLVVLHMLLAALLVTALVFALVALWPRVPA